MSVVAIIPARGASKRIPRKNIREFCGKPMIAWSIQAAVDSGCFDRIIVSTDDAEIAQVAQEWGAEAPFVRPAELSDDFVGTRPVIQHAVDWLRSNAQMPSHVCSLYPTALFVRAADLRAGYERLVESGADFAFTVATFEYPIQRALRILPEGGVEMIQPEHRLTRSQDLEETYHDAGQFYWGRAEAFMGDATVFSGSSVPIVVPRWRVQDIDTMEDLAHAEALFRALEDES